MASRSRPTLSNVTLFLSCLAAVTGCSTHRAAHAAIDQRKNDAGGRKIASATSAVGRVERLEIQTKTDEATLRAWVAGHPEDVGAVIRFAYLLSAKNDSAGACALIDTASRAGHDVRLLRAEAVLAVDPMAREKLARRVLSISPNDVTGQELLALSLYAQGRYEEAADEFSHFTARCLTAPSGWYDLGLACLYSGRRNEAIEAFGASLLIGLTAENGLCVEPLLGLAEAYDGDPDWPGARLQYLSLAKQSSDTDLATRFPSLPHGGATRHLRSPPFLDCLDVGLVYADPANSAKLWFVSRHATAGLAGVMAGDELLAVNGQPIEDRAALMHGTMELPNAGEITFRVLRDGTELDLRAHAVTEADTLQHVRVLLAKGAEEARARNHQTAAEAFQDVLDDAFFNREAVLNRSLALHLAGKRDAALAAIGTWCRLSPYDTDLLRYQVTLQGESSDRAGLAESLERVREFCPQDGYFAVHEAWCAHETGDTRRGDEMFERALALGQCGSLIQRLAVEIDRRDAATSGSGSFKSASKPTVDDSGQRALLMLMFARALGGALSGGGGDGYDAEGAAWQNTANNSAMQARMQ